MTLAARHPDLAQPERRHQVVVTEQTGWMSRTAGQAFRAGAARVTRPTRVSAASLPLLPGRTTEAHLRSRRRAAAWPEAGTSAAEQAEAEAPGQARTG